LSEKTYRLSQRWRARYGGSRTGFREYLSGEPSFSGRRPPDMYLMFRWNIAKVLPLRPGFAGPA
jgi:hypothetical protein